MGEDGHVEAGTGRGAAFKAKERTQGDAGISRAVATKYLKGYIAR
jgi:hypothetical protein